MILGHTRRMRLREVPPVILASAALFSFYEWAVFASTFWRPGLLGVDFDAPGADWMVPYTAARAFFDGDGERFTGRVNAAFSWWLPHPLAFRPWVYPPSYLLLVLPFSALPFGLSYAAFEMASAALLVLTLCLGSDRRGWRGFLCRARLLLPDAARNRLGHNALP